MKKKYSLEDIQKYKNPTLSAVLSFVIPGAGSIYNGSVLKGILFLIVYVVGLFLFVLPGVIVWIISIYDAYKEAKFLNSKNFE